MVAIFGAAARAARPDTSDLNDAYVGPVAGHLLGFDGQGRDLLSRLLAGARTVDRSGPPLVVLLSMVAGVVLAIVAAWRGGWSTPAISSVLDILFAFPGDPARRARRRRVRPEPDGRRARAGRRLHAVHRPGRCAAPRCASAPQPYIAACEVQGLSDVAICARHLVPNVDRR